MRILFLATELFASEGGIQKFNNNFANALFELRHKLAVVSLNDLRDLGKYKSLAVGCGRRGNLKKIFFIFHCLKQLITFRPTLLICGHVHFSYLCFLIKALSGIPYYTILHGIEMQDLDIWEQIGLRSSRKIISNSRYTRKNFLEQFPKYPSERIYILPPTFSETKFMPQPKSSFLSQKWGIGPEDKVILTICRLAREEQYKGYDKVIMAVEDLKKTFPRIKYLIVGRGNDTERIRRLIKKLSLEGTVILTGFVLDEEIRDYYNLCNLFVMPSLGEGFGTVFLEALACGRPVIAGNQDASCEPLLNGELGLLVEPTDIKAIAQAIERVLKGEVPEKITDAAYLRRMVIAEFGFARFKERLAGLIC